MINNAMRSCQPVTLAKDSSGVIAFLLLEVGLFQFVHENIFDVCNITVTFPRRQVLSSTKVKSYVGVVCKYYIHIAQEAMPCHQWLGDCFSCCTTLKY